MTEPTLLRTLAIWLVVFATLPATTFPIVYAFSHWYRTRIGRALMVKAIGLMMLVDFAVLFRIRGVDPPDWLTFGVYLVVVAGIYYQCTALIITKIQARRDQRRWAFEPDPDDDTHRRPRQ